MGKRLNLPESLVSEYVDEKKTLKILALKYNCNQVSIWEFLKKRGIQCRPRTEHLKNVPKTAEAREKISSALRGRPKSAAQQDRLRNHGFKGFHHSEESKEKISKSLCGRKFSPDHCMKISNGVSGEKHGNWRGGITSHKYCEKFNKALKESIRNDHGRKCRICREPENGKLLDIHHINFDKQAGCYGRRWNLVPLCRKDHAWTTNHRFESFHLLMNHWAMNPDINFGGDINYIFQDNLAGTFNGYYRQAHILGQP